MALCRNLSFAPFIHSRGTKAPLITKCYFSRLFHGVSVWGGVIDVTLKRSVHVIRVTPTAKGVSRDVTYTYTDFSRYNR